MGSERVDVAILGGGLAGLSLALQLRQQVSDLSITVIERRAFPVPEAAHKVGESTVEIGAHYFDTILGLGEHLRTRQLPKLGLRFFFPHDDNSDIASRFELGGSSFLPVPSFQLDRGIFENYLAEECERRGVSILGGAKVTDVRLSSSESNDGHAIRISSTAGDGIIAARWVVDASGRAGIVKHQLGLAEKNGHDVNAVWFRVRQEIDIDSWSHDPSWRVRNGEGNSRRLSTNHLMGAGYWVWLIPLSSGSTSVGIVADAGLHPLNEYNRFDKAMDWLRRYEPQCAEALAAALSSGPDMLQDFLALKHYSHNCRQVYSPDRWCITGEAGAFLDPFYSPGSDFIAISNNFVTDLIRRDYAGESIAGVAPVFDQIYLNLVENTLTLFEGRYPLWGNQALMPIKVVWDYAYYWGVLALLFFNQRLCDLGTYVKIRSTIERIRSINKEVQDVLLAWNDCEPRFDVRGFVDMTRIPFLYDLNAALSSATGGEEVVSRLSDNVTFLGELARAVVSRASARHPQLARDWATPDHNERKDITAVFEALGL